MEKKERIHFIDPYLRNPMHRITVTLIGAGGNGGQMLSALARMDAALKAKGNPGLDLTLWDGDTVEEPNIGRQLFAWSDVNRYKSECLVTRFNRFFNLDWKAECRHFTESDPLGNIVVTCVDSVKARQTVAKAFAGQQSNDDRLKMLYWMDLGNAQRTGQAVLGSRCIHQPQSQTYETVSTLPTVDKVFTLSTIKDEDSGPSCSLAEALTKQDLFINSSLVALSSSLLWQLLSEPAIDKRGLYLNLETMKASPIMI